MNSDVMISQSEQQTWIAQNQQFLVSRWRAVQGAIESETKQIDFSKSDTIARQMARPPALLVVAKVFSLSDFEQFILLISAGYELDSQFAQTLKATPRSRPCFELALSLAPTGHWSATTPAAPLRHWRLIELDQGSSLVSSPLRIDERIVHYMSGISYIDSRLHALVELGSALPVLAPSLLTCVEQLVSSLENQERCNQPMLAQLCGPSESDMKTIAQSACEKMGLIAYFMSARDLPEDQNERQALGVLWQRESLLDRAVLIINATKESQAAVRRFVRGMFTPCIVVSRNPLDQISAGVVRINVPVSDSSEQLALWHCALGQSASHINGGLDHIVSQFSFSAQDIANLSQQALSVDEHSEIEQSLWQQCRLHSGKGLDSLAEKIESSHTWDDLVLPDAQKQTLKDIILYARHRHRVYSDWRFGEKSNRGQGGSCLFFGPSGTGKTMAASVIANTLQLDLYRVDLSQVINKYIGETEKNLARIFDKAENSGAILLFDEADSLFAKRTEVKTSNDRYANIGTSYLLQRMESYSGLAILTTNLKKEMDSAFMRRIRFAVQFPFPDQLSRRQIWEKMFPADAPVGGIDFAKLASLDLAGGNIRNIALNAAFYAAEKNTAICMPHLAKAARREYGKLDKPIRENELKNWT